MSTTNRLSRLSIHLRGVFAFTLLMAASSWAGLNPISYIDENGDEKFLELGSYTLLDTLLGGEYGQPGDNGVISLPGGWYVASNDMSTDNPVDFAGDVQLVIPDGVTVFVTNYNATNKFTGAGNFTVYGQKDGSGVLNIDVFDVRKYRAAYKDLDSVFGDNWQMYYYHYKVIGKTEIETKQRPPFM